MPPYTMNTNSETFEKITMSDFTAKSAILTSFLFNKRQKLTKHYCKKVNQNKKNEHHTPFIFSFQDPSRSSRFDTYYKPRLITRGQSKFFEQLLRQKCTQQRELSSGFK